MEQGNLSGKLRQTSHDLSTEECESAILQAIHGIRFGAVEVTVHDSRVVQIECKEKIRFPSAGNKKLG